MELSKYIAFHYLLPFQAIDLFIFIINLKIKILNVRVSFLCIVVLLICIIIEYKTSPFSTTAQHSAFKAFHQALIYLHCLYTVFLRNIPPHNELSALSFTYLDEYHIILCLILLIYACIMCTLITSIESRVVCAIHTLPTKVEIRQAYITCSKRLQFLCRYVMHKRYT